MMNAKAWAGQLAVATVFALGATQAYATDFNLSLSGNVADFSYFAGPFYDQGVLNLAGLDDSNAITVAQGDTINGTITLDQLFTIPASEVFTADLFITTGSDFPAGDTETTGTMTFLNGAAVVMTGAWDDLSSTQLSGGPFFSPPDNGPLTFDSIQFSMFVTTLSAPATLESSLFYYTTVRNVPEPASWAMMVAGFGLVGGAMRRRSYATA
jgi:hypothetical protein